MVPTEGARRREPAISVDRGGRTPVVHGVHPTAADVPLPPTVKTKLPRFFLVSEAATMARVSEWTIRHEIREGRLRARRIGRLVRILDTDLAAWMHGGAS